VSGDQLGDCLFSATEFGDMIHFSSAGAKSATAMEHHLRHRLSTKLADFIYSKKIIRRDDDAITEFRMQFYVLEPEQLFELIRDEAWRMLRVTDPETCLKYLSEAKLRAEAKE
jgi:hypothetical protein